MVRCCLRLILHRLPATHAFVRYHARSGYLTHTFTGLRYRIYGFILVRALRVSGSLRSLRICYAYDHLFTRLRTPAPRFALPLITRSRHRLRLVRSHVLGPYIVTDFTVVVPIYYLDVLLPDALPSAFFSHRCSLVTLIYRFSTHTPTGILPPRCCYYRTLRCYLRLLPIPLDVGFYTIYYVVGSLWSLVWILAGCPHTGFPGFSRTFLPFRYARVCHIPYWLFTTPALPHVYAPPARTPLRALRVPLHLFILLPLPRTRLPTCTSRLFATTATPRPHGSRHTAAVLHRTACGFSHRITTPLRTPHTPHCRLPQRVLPHAHTAVPCVTLYRRRLLVRVTTHTTTSSAFLYHGYARCLYAAQRTAPSRTRGSTAAPLLILTVCLVPDATLPHAFSSFVAVTRSCWITPIARLAFRTHATPRTVTGLPLTPRARIALLPPLHPLPHRTTRCITVTVASFILPLGSYLYGDVTAVFTMIPRPYYTFPFTNLVTTLTLLIAILVPYTICYIYLR